MDTDMDTLHEHTYECGWALRDFAGALDAVLKKMNSALGKARAGDLQVEGPLIIAPQSPGGPPRPQLGPFTPEGAKQAAAEHRAAVAEFDTAKAEYDAKAAVFEECKDLVNKARVDEENAHTELRSVMRDQSEEGMSMRTVGSTTTAQALGYVSSFENPHSAATLKAAKMGNIGHFFQDWAAGNRNVQLSSAEPSPSRPPAISHPSRAVRKIHQQDSRKCTEYCFRLPRKEIVQLP